MTKENDETSKTRRSVLRRTGVAAAGGFGLAASSESVSAGKKKDGKSGKKKGKKKSKREEKGIKCPTCDENKGGPTRYKIAHRPPGNPEKCIDLCLPAPAARAHLRRHDEDTCGPCETNAK